MSNLEDIGLSPVARDSRLYLRWACDMVLRQSQRASYRGNLKDENCFQLIQYLMTHHPHSTSQPTSNRNMLPALLFTFQKVVATEMATKMVDIYDLDLLKGKPKAKEIIRAEIENIYGGVPPFLQRVLERGIGIHHGDISAPCKDLVERLFNKKLIQIVFNTSSLAEGVHMPCQTVVFLQDKQSLVNNKLFRQCAGRAGRQGDSDVGFVVVTGNYTMSRMQTLLKGLDKEERKDEGEYGSTDEVAAARSSLVPAARLQLQGWLEAEGKGRRLPLPLCFTGHRNFNHQLRKVNYMVGSIRDMIGDLSVKLCTTSVDIDLRLRPLFAFVLRMLVSQVRNAHFAQQPCLSQEVLARQVINLALWFRSPIESKAYSSSSRSTNHRQREYDLRLVPLLDDIPLLLRRAVLEWNQRIFRSIFLAEEGNLLAPPDTRPGADRAVAAVYDETGAVKKQFGALVCQSQLLLENTRVCERLAPEIDGLSGHAFAYVASGINKNNMKDLFAVPYDTLPLLDPSDIAIKSQQGFLLKLIFMGGDISVYVDQIKVKYGVKKYLLKRELSGVRGALVAVQRFVENSLPLADSEEDPMKGVLSSAISRLDGVIKAVSGYK